MMHNDSRSTIPKIVMDTSVLPEAEQFDYWAAHSREAQLQQLVPGPFLARGDIWNLGDLQITLVEVDPFIAVRDRILVNAVAADCLQLVQLVEGTITFESDGKTMELNAPASFLLDYGEPSTTTSTRISCLILYFSRDFIEEAIGPIIFQGPLNPVPELRLLHNIAVNMIRFFPLAVATSAPLYAIILRDLAAAAIVRAGANQPTDHLSTFAAAKAYVAAQPPGTLSVASITAALGISRSALYRLFERDGGLLAYDRVRRLRAAHRAICNPLNTSTLVELAARYGFRDQTALIRSFRKAFNATPSKLRQHYTAITPVTNETPPNNIQVKIGYTD